MKLQYWISIFVLVTISLSISAQTTQRKFLAGVKVMVPDISRHFDHRRNFEIQAYRRISDITMLKSAIGYSWVGKDGQYPNFDYRNFGFYAKAGFLIFREHSKGVAFHPGICLNYAAFVDGGKYVLAGENFGDLVGHPRRNMHAWSVEPFVEFRIDISKRWSVVTTNKYDWLISLTEIAHSYPNLYIPGRGRTAWGAEITIVYTIQ